jgi:hypothetical protein
MPAVEQQEAKASGGGSGRLGLRRKGIRFVGPV